MKIPDCTHCLLFNDGPLLSVGACGLCDMDYRPIVIMMIEESSMKSLKIVEFLIQRLYYTNSTI